MDRVEPLPAGERTRVAHLASLAYVLDNSIRLPGTRMRIGLDALIGLVPGVGDAVGGAMSAYIVLQAARLGAPVAVLLRMLLNILVEVVVGGIPLLGDLFDAGFKANVRNLTLLQRSLEAPGATRRASLAVVAGVAIALLLLLALMVAIAVVVFGAALRLLQGDTVQF